MSTVKMIAVFAIIFGCFAMLYPRFLHPLVLRALRLHNQPEEQLISRPPAAGRNIPPGMRPYEAKQEKPKEKSDLKHHVRPGPHPGLRAAAEMRQQQQQQQGTGRGMMGIVLPMYAVGIVLYLIYTLIKVFSKKTDSQEKEATSYSQYNNFSYDNREGKFSFGDDFDPDEDFREYMQKKHKQQELEELLMKAGDRHITEYEMLQLQQRLEETESQMARILQAMQSVQQHVGVNENKMDATTGDMPQKTNKVTPSNSSPDLENYEVLGSNGSEGSSDYSMLNDNGFQTSPEVEVLPPLAEANKQDGEQLTRPEHGEASDGGDDQAGVEGQNESSSPAAAEDNVTGETDILLQGKDCETDKQTYSSVRKRNALAATSN